MREYMRKPAYRLASVHRKTRDAMIAAIIEDNCIEAGWFYHYCFPGCLPEGGPMGPYKTQAEAIAAAQEDAAQ